MRCQILLVFQGMDPTSLERFRSAQASTISSELTTTPNTAIIPAAPTSTSSFPRPSIRPWRRRGSTSCRSSFNMRPINLKSGTWPERREALGDTVIDTLSEYAPNLKNIILHRQVVTPWDLENEFGLTEGNIFQGELTLDQLFFLRPVPGWAKYRTPIKNLYMCGACTHPGGGVMAASGRLAALEILKDWKTIRI